MTAARKITVQQLKEMIRKVLKEQMATNNGINTVAQGGKNSDEPISEENALTRAQQENKEKNRLFSLALQKFEPKDLLKFIVKNNSVQWLASTLSRLGIK